MSHRWYDGLVELVEEGVDLAGENNEHVGKIKVYGRRGPDYIEDPEVDVAGVGWVLAEHWWPYQRPTFVIPPFAGFVSGHSIYSRRVAEVLTTVTGSPNFPGSMSQFEISANEFLVIEDGPTVDMVLQWLLTTMLLISAVCLVFGDVSILQLTIFQEDESGLMLAKMPLSLPGVTLREKQELQTGFGSKAYTSLCARILG